MLSALLKISDTGDTTELGTALADEFVLKSRPGGAERPVPTRQKALQRLLQRVDREARPLQLGILKRARLANSFKWRLLEQGVDEALADELTRALLLRLAAERVVPVSSERPRPRPLPAKAPAPRKVQALLAETGQHLATGEYAEAASGYHSVLGIDPRHAVAHNNLGIALSKLGRYQLAEGHFRSAIGIRASFPEAHFNLGSVLQSTGRFDESEVPLRRALKLKPGYLDAQISLGQSLALLGRLPEARRCYEKALRVAPRNTLALVAVGQLHALEGRFAEAEAAYREALEVEPEAPHAWAALVWLRRMTSADDAWLRRAQEIAAGGLGLIEEANMRFALGKFCDDTGDYARAFRNYQRANELHRMRASPYDRAQHTRFVDDLLRVYTREALGRAATGGSDSERPVFVVGMPRSGTSLVEQIIASHPLAHGAGELRFWTTFVSRHEDALRRAVPEESARRRLAREYLRLLGGHSADAQRVVDKAPVNSDYLGLIHGVFPRARFIYLERDPLDTCLSCYFQQFSPAINFTTDLADLAHYYREHRRLISHWRSVLPPGALLEVPYAALVGEQKRWTRRILEFLDLPWDERCLDFHRNTRAVSTASAWQVRQKIYKSSLGRWRNYEKFIKPLLALRDLAD